MRFKFIIAFCATLILLSCSNIGCDILNSNYSIHITGKWIEDTPIRLSQNLMQNLEYTFNSDYTFENARVVIDSATNQTLGFRFASSGFYNITGNQLTITTTQIFTISQQPEPLYVPKNELKAQKIEGQTLNLKFRILNDRMIWKFPPCPPNANCIGTQEFFKAVKNFKIKN